MGKPNFVASLTEKETRNNSVENFFGLVQTTTDFALLKIAPVFLGCSCRGLGCQKFKPMLQSLSTSVNAPTNNMLGMVIITSENCRNRIATRNNSKALLSLADFVESFCNNLRKVVASIRSEFQKSHWALIASSRCTRFIRHDTSTAKTPAKKKVSLMTEFFSG